MINLNLIRPLIGYQPDPPENSDVIDETSPKIKYSKFTKSFHQFMNHILTAHNLNRIILQPHNRNQKLLLLSRDPHNRNIEITQIIPEAKLHNMSLKIPLLVTLNPLILNKSLCSSPTDENVSVAFQLF